MHQQSISQSSFPDRLLLLIRLQSNKMNKCEHNEKMITFCLSDHCEWKQASGCQRCMKKYHNHITNSKFIHEEQVIQLLNKISLETLPKPNCRKIQQSFYSYFTALKNQITSSLDILCKTLINSIGSPYLIENHLLSVYKRIKNKEYKRLQQKQFKNFYQTAKKANPTEIAKEQTKFYIQHIKSCQKIIFKLENVLSTYENFFKQINQTFSHEKAPFQSLTFLIKKTIENAGMNLNLSQFHERQMEKNKAQRTQKQEKIDKNDIKKFLNQYDSILSTQYSSRLASTAKETITKSLEISSAPLTKKQDPLQNSIHHKFGVRDFGTFEKLDKSDSQQIKTKRPISLDKKIALNFSLQIPSKNKRKKSDIQMFEDMKKLSSNQTQRHKISFPERHESILDDFFSENSSKKPQNSTLTPFDKRESSLRENEISIRKEKLIEMMKNQSSIMNNGEKQKPKEQSNQHSFNSKMEKNEPKFFNNNSLLIMQTSELTSNANPGKNYSNFFGDKKHIQEIKINQQQKIQEKKLNETKHKLSTSASNRHEALKPFAQKNQIFQIPHIPEDIEKSSQGSLQVLKKIIPKKNMNAHPKLPIQEIEEKPKELACSRLIIVPTGSKFQMDKSDECDSPLLKKKVTHNVVKNGEKINLKYQKKEKQEKSELKQNEERSLNLLIKSINQKPDQAISSLEAALRQAPNNLSAAQYLSFLYLENSKPKEALNICNLILDRFEIIIKENQELLIKLENNKAAALNMLGRYSEAVVLLQRCIKLGQKDTLLKNLGDAYYFSSNYEKAIFYYEKTIKMSVHYDQAYYNMAVCLYLQNNFHNANQSILKALQTAPNNIEYLELKKYIDLKISQSINF